MDKILDIISQILATSSLGAAFLYVLTPSKKLGSLIALVCLGICTIIDGLRPGNHLIELLIDAWASYFWIGNYRMQVKLKQFPRNEKPPESH